jgi:glycosyltransferase involved in cell wall biosynthesis
MLNAFFGATVPSLTPLLATVLSMGRPGYLPSTVPATMGTQVQVDEWQRTRTGPVFLLEPPVDVESDGATDGGEGVRRRLGVRSGDVLIAVVGRLEPTMKLAPLLRTMEAVALLAAVQPVHLLVVGDGPSRSRVEEEAEGVRRRCGRPVVHVVGQMVDPRPAYAAADIVVGMGSSALRAMAVGKPTVVVSGRGFERVVSPEHLDYFRRMGYFGDGPAEGAVGRLAAVLSPLVSSADDRRRLGAFGAAEVRRRYGLEVVTDHVETLYSVVRDSPPARWRTSADAVGTAARYGTHRALLRPRALRRRASARLVPSPPARPDSLWAAAGAAPSPRPERSSL